MQRNSLDLLSNSALHLMSPCSPEQWWEAAEHFYFSRLFGYLYFTGVLLRAKFQEKSTQFLLVSFSKSDSFIQAKGFQKTGRNQDGKLSANCSKKKGEEEDRKLNNEGRPPEMQGIPHPWPYVEDLCNVVNNFLWMRWLHETMDALKNFSPFFHFSIKFNTHPPFSAAERLTALQDSCSCQNGHTLVLGTPRTTVCWELMKEFGRCEERCICPRKRRETWLDLLYKFPC